MANVPMLNESDDDPVLTQFDIPVVCNSDSGEVACCDPCTDWIFCLKRSYYELDLDGFEFEDWLPGHWLSSNVQLASAQLALAFSNAGAGETLAFDGLFLAEPPFQDALAQACAPHRTDDCPYTHIVRHERTILTDSPVADAVKRFGLNVQTECVVVSEVKYLRFTVNLVWQGAINNAVYVPAYNPGDVFCPGKGVTPYEPAEGSEWFCCPVLQSGLIALAGITSLADLNAVTLNPYDPFTVVWDSGAGLYIADGGQECLQSTNTWVCIRGYLFILCSNGSPVCEYLAINDCVATANGTDIDTILIGEHDEYDGPYLGCSKWLVNGESAAPCGFFYCVSEPIKYVVEGTYTLKVIDRECAISTDCKSCFPDPESPVAIPIKHGDVRFTWVPGPSCIKELTIVHPDCLTVDKVYWSDGTTTIGDATKSYTLKNLDPDEPTNYKESVSAIIMMTNGCVYCWEEDLTCGCCEGLAGSISITQEDPENECEYTITAHISGDELCPQARIVFVVHKPGSACLASIDLFDCECYELEPGSITCIHPCVYGLGDGQSFPINVTGGGWKLTWWVVDGPCGCESERTTVPLYCTECECCEEKIVFIRVNISAVANTEGCADCDDVNINYYLEPSDIISDCTWMVDGPTISCGPNPEDNFFVQVFFTFTCANTGGGPEVDLTGTVSITGVGGASYERGVLDVGMPADCELLTGSYVRSSDSSGVCDFSSSTCYVEVVTA